MPVVEKIDRGKGSHRIVYYGSAFTVVKDLNKEISRGLLHGLCQQLGINEKDLEGM